ncbi:MAG TPA: hypothetical protein RMH99_04245 [Sandaracinaceae bacterium LLY-WYZ-13_1]|nr:hypothetical protein [Sandaracinaceae bacterium LLY-WYZ-13_1]
MLLRTRLIPALLAVLWLAGCEAGTRPIPGVDAAAGADAGRDAAPDRPDTGPLPDAGPPLDDVLIYAHSADTLYTFSAFTNTVTEVGVFTEAGSGAEAPFMLDLAVDADGNLFTSSRDRLWRVDAETAEVTEVGDFGLGDEQLFALSFITASEAPAGEPILIGATNEGRYFEVDRETAATSFLGEYPEGWFSSGDIVSVDELGTFATLRRDDFSSDVLARILFSSDGSSTVTVIGPVRNASEDFTQIFGLGYWGRDMYGFSNSGQLIRIDRDTGQAEVVSTETGTEQFWGAGVTTQVPVLI